MLQSFFGACRRLLKLGGSKFPCPWVLFVARLVIFNNVGNTPNQISFKIDIQAHSERHSSSGH